MFASNLIPVNIKLRLVRLWIMNLDDITSNEIEKLCLNNCDSKCCLLDVLINEKDMDAVKMNKGFSIVNNIIIQERDSSKYDTVLFIWDLLPKCLGSFCCAEEPTIGDNNLLCLLNLAEAYPPPEKLDWTLNAQRNTAYTISSIIKCYQLKSSEHQNLLSSLLQHILTIIRLSSADATNTIKNHKDFPSILADLCLSERNSVCSLSFEILIQLCQRPQAETLLLHSIALQHRHILTAICRICHNCVVSSLTLFQIIIRSKEENERNFVELEEIHDVEFLKSVFFQLETIISLGLDWVSDHAWKCMETMLSADFSSYPHLQELQYDFAADPWLYLLIRNFKSYSENCLEFLKFWFRRYVLNNEGKKYIVHGKSILCTSFLDKTVVHISITLINQTYKNEMVMIKAKEIIQLIVKSLQYYPKSYCAR
ncbi:uncharacterized protein LOC126842684 [Adelges cooleyi]|uniref:uncharacterized protein LOC126842684 n=1 Tax=Adelges cooleyi TaxID=133065 RepID=UPI00217FE09E|nr:uncharacterized protein LOC126842684 [Adelges cooleyi]